jgi:hypothetical protein
VARSGDGHRLGGETKNTTIIQEITSMRIATSLRLLLVPAALFAAACDDARDPLEPPVAEEGLPAPAPQHTTGPLEDLAYWADGYLKSRDKLASSSTPEATLSFNRSGGRITITKVGGTTGRYVARFGGLSALLGTANTVHVSADGVDATYCKPVGGRLVHDSVEVRCFKIGTGAAANALFSLQVVGKRDDRAFAFAHQPTAADYSPAAAGSWNPTGATRVRRAGVGTYVVTFSGLGARLSTGVGGHVQANAVGTGKAHCKTYEWGSGTDVGVEVRCYTPAGTPADSKFTVLFTPPAAHLAYAWADQPSSAYYSPYAVFSSNPVGGAVTITNYGTGVYGSITYAD